MTELGAGLTVSTEGATAERVNALARRLLDEPHFREAAGVEQTAQREAGGYRRAADELERYLERVGGAPARRAGPAADRPAGPAEDQDVEH